MHQLGAWKARRFGQGGGSEVQHGFPHHHAGTGGGGGRGWGADQRCGTFLHTRRGDVGGEGPVGVYRGTGRAFALTPPSWRRLGSAVRFLASARGTPAGCSACLPPACRALKIIIVHQLTLSGSIIWDVCACPVTERVELSIQDETG
jgi:hypothetical protein